ncbi:hypothetical protein GQ43DRAFT_478861 [Delitschia confertaspora ATCC 74209]|uniref:Uncharacterized protein n=1 Tax=Delitschia confertaspora ATCC 74209 TaxID=1513339 RepID=A0A9P4JR33_9PLEO|nr:hypothetical protein GQ43DRAFT_478861 [Delitschia confertaspora ATCC 74209]
MYLSALCFGLLFVAPLQTIARPCPEGGCVALALTKREANPGIIPIPKPALPKPAVPPKPALPKPIVPVLPKPEVKPQPKAAACKRWDKRCEGDITFDAVNYSEKGRKLQTDLDKAIANPKDNNHNYESEISRRYSIKVEEHSNPNLDRKVQTWFKSGIDKDLRVDFGDVLNRDTSFTRYQVYGMKNPEGSTLSIVDVQISVKHRVIIPSRLFRNGKYIDPHYKDIPEKERMVMSEHIYQLWIRAIREQKVEYPNVKPQDLRMIIGVDVDNGVAKQIINEISKRHNGANTITLTEKQPEFAALASSSSGVSKFRMLMDHAGDMGKLKPVRVDVNLQNSFPVVVWSFKQ